jgi:hypothetical protein
MVTNVLEGGKLEAVARQEYAELARQAAENALRKAPAAKAPAQRQCAKCGGVDLHVRFARAGEYEDGIWIGSRKEDVWEPHTGRTDPSRPWDQFWVADSLAITCRTCQYRWVEKPRDAQKVGYFESAGQDEQKWAEFGRAAFAACAYLDKAVPLTVGSNDERIRWAADEILRLRERLREVAR